jgi:eukaryotic-like serine/threonine-protein kinase
MPLSVGDKLGPYEILAPIGAGGMGEVYKARDTKLDREVAIKVLPSAVGQDPERLARFEREAKVLASLNHPNIAQIYGIEDRALIMELVPGATLKGPFPLDTALTYARQIADALEAAHEKGITHRDLKPANIMITPDGVVKVLDFGLASAPSHQATSDPTNSPTMTMAATQAGTIIGTAAYMSPEQAAGKVVDKRSDIWSFGVVLWEMLTGARLFDGETFSHTLADVLRAPIDFAALPASTPAPIVELLKRCLDRNPKTRLQAIAEARIAIEKFLRDPASAGEEQRLVRLPSRLVPILTAVATLLLVIAATLAFIHFREKPPALPVQRYTIAAPEGSTILSFAISPDGRYLAIAAAVNGKQQLWLRPLDALQAQPMPFTEDATYPFWSPDSRYIGFFAKDRLKKVAATGGPSQSLCDAPDGRGGSWGRGDVIVFASASAEISIQWVSAAGGLPSGVFKTKDNLRYPVFLPDGRHFLYVARGLESEKSGIYVGSLDGKENRRITADSSTALFAPPLGGEKPGHILFVRENTLMAQPFDTAGVQIRGDVFPVAEGVSLAANGTYLPATVSDSGILLYAGGASGLDRIGWYDRAGKFLGPVSTPGAVLNPAISPDGNSVVFTRRNGVGGDLWLRDLTRGTETRLTSHPSLNVAPIWSPQGDRIVFASNRVPNRQRLLNLFQKPASGSGQDETLLADAHSKDATQWSRDGRFIVYAERDPNDKMHLWVLPMEGSEKKQKGIPFLQREFNDLMGQLSPDSHWMAYTSDQSGRREVYVRPFPRAEGQWTISVGGGEQPRWRGDGKELFYEAAGGKMMAVPVKASAGTKPMFEAGAPVALFDAQLAPSGFDNVFMYDVTADGKRFLITTSAGSGTASSPPLNVVVNWNAGSKK